MPGVTRKLMAAYAVDDIDVAEAFYERLLGREPDARSGETCIAWQIAPGSWLELREGAQAGQGGPVRLAVADVEAARASLDLKFGIEAAVARTAGGSATCSFCDPFGNPIVYAEQGKP